MNNYSKIIKEYSKSNYIKITREAGENYNILLLFPEKHIIRSYGIGIVD